VNADHYPDFVVYGLVVCGSAAGLLAVLRSEIAAALWYGLIPIVCVSFLYLTGTKVKFSWMHLVSDLRYYRKVLVLIGVMAVASALSSEYAWRVLGQKGRPAFSLSFIVTNIAEELLFRATGIAAFELVERRLFGASNQKRIIALTSAVFALVHLPTLSRFLASYYPLTGETLEHLTLAANLAVPFFLGMVLGNVYSRSRNLLSSLAVHWGINLGVNVCRSLAFFLMASVHAVSL
jgi:membrane protease YdiL (CAAX protease family)